MGKPFIYVALRGKKRPKSGGPRLATPRLRQFCTVPTNGVSVRYKVFDINKFYLTSNLSSHTWNYTLPEAVLGSYLRMVSGVFMQKGNLVAMLNLFKRFKTLTATVEAANSAYKTIEPSFPAPMAPTAFCLNNRPSLVLRPLNGNPSLGLPKQNAPLVKLNRGKRSHLPSRLEAPNPKRLGFLKKLKRLRRLKKLKSLARPRLKFLNKTHKLSRLKKRVGAQTALSALRPSQQKLTFPKESSLYVWNLLYQQPLLNYSLKYCRLSRRVRKILKNKYRYSKYYFVIAPYKRRLFTLHLWKYILKFHDEPTFELKFEAFLKNFTSPDSDALLWSLFYTQQRLALKKLLGR